MEPCGEADPSCSATMLGATLSEDHWVQGPDVACQRITKSQDRKQLSLRKGFFEKGVHM